MILRPKIVNLKQIILEELDNYLFEIFEKSIPTEFKIIKNNIYGDVTYDVYEFETKSGIKYVVEFYNTYILNLNELPNVLKYFPNEDILKLISIGFTTFDYNKNVSDELSGSMNDPYLKRTNKNEQYEVLGKVAYIIENFIKNNPQYNIYEIGKNTYSSNLLAYLKMFQNIFSNKFHFVEDKSKNYNEGAYYFIKNS